MSKPASNPWAPGQRFFTRDDHETVRESARKIAEIAAGTSAGCESPSRWTDERRQLILSLARELVEMVDFCLGPDGVPFPAPRKPGRPPKTPVATGPKANFFSHKPRF